MGSLQIQTKEDKKILKKLDDITKQCDNHIKNYRLNLYAEDLHNFFWHDFCDTYLEESKVQFKDEKLKLSTQNILLHVLIKSLRLLHPILPFVTEEIWQKLRDFDTSLSESIMIQ